MELNICGKNLFNPYINNSPQNEKWLEIENGNVLHYINATGKNQRVIFGKHMVVPNTDVVFSRDNDNVSIALNELDKNENVIRQSWLGATGTLEKVIKILPETVYFSIIVTSDKWVKIVDEYVKIQVEYGTKKTDFEEYKGSKIPFIPDNNHYILKQRIEQKEGLFIWLDNEDDVRMEVEVSVYNPTIKTLVEEIVELRRFRG